MVNLSHKTGKGKIVPKEGLEKIEEDRRTGQSSMEKEECRNLFLNEHNKALGSPRNKKERGEFVSSFHSAGGKKGGH